jgi:hypothetical protein
LTRFGSLKALKKFCQAGNTVTNLLKYIALYLPYEKIEELKATGVSYKLRFIPYD